MDAFRPQGWFRAFGIAASLTIAVRRITDQLFTGPERLFVSLNLPPAVPPGAVFRAVLAAEVLAFAGFLAAFLYSTKSIEPRGVRLGPVLVLLVQLPLGLVFGAELAIVATAAVPFVLAGRTAWTWLCFEVALVWILTLPGSAPANIELSPGLMHTPFTVALMLTLIEATAWMLFAFSAGYLIVRAERNRRDLAYRNAELAATQTLLAESSAMNERLRISRELHDTVGHHLVGLSLNLEIASHLAGGKALTPIQRAQLIAKLLLADIRETVSGMRDERRLDVVGALRQLAAGIMDLRVHVDVAPELAAAEPQMAHFFFRCAQEATTNARKHAAARNLWLSIRLDGAGFRMVARDDGRGSGRIAFGNGLRGMKERSEELGATFQTTSERGAGFKIDIWAPSQRRESEVTA